MNDQQKRARLRELLSDSKGAIAPGVTDALFARLAQDCGYAARRISPAMPSTKTFACRTATC